MKKVKAVLWPRMDADGNYPLKIRYYSEEEERYKYKPIGIVVSAKKYFNAATGQVRASHEKHQELNKVIQERLSDFSIEKNDNQSSFLVFLKNHYENLIELGHYGNAKKFMVLYNHIVKFQKSKDLKFSDFDLNFLKKFHAYLRNAVNSDNTIHIYLNKLKRSYYLARQQRLITGDNIWEFYKYTGTQVESKALSRDEFSLLRNTNLKDGRYEKVRREALILFFINGMRIGDLLLLKWKNVHSNFIVYTMRKTKMSMRIAISEPLAHLLLTNIDSKFYDKDNLMPYFAQLNYIENYANKHKEEYVLNYLNNIEFKDEFEKYNKVQSLTASWNKHAKELGESLGINTKLCSHVMRHTYSSLLLFYGKANIKEVSQTLGHTNIAITNKYIKTLNNMELDSLTNDFYGKFRLPNQSYDYGKLDKLNDDIEIPDNSSDGKIIDVAKDFGFRDIDGLGK